ncbi:MAG: hypothetical protein HYS80_02605, partial [Candidatus Aenigmarchaeota archaeon]|nr:hypothetical protein [Candidatus Aenigmarchaeota archaeon]
NRFVFIPKDVPEGTELAVSGEAGLDLSLEFDTERKILRAGDVEIDFAFAQQGEAEATEVTLHADRFEVTGAASGRWKNIQWTNREGKLVLYENGDINARNAEVFASDIYVNGYVEKRGNKIKAWAYGDSSVNDGQTIVIDRRSGYGVKVPQARSVIPPEVATIEIQELGPPKPLSSDEISEPDVNLLRALARSLLGGTESNPTNKDLHVLISHNNDDGRTKITAIGTGEIGFYGDGEHAKFHRPYFIGKNGASLLSLETNGETTIATGGQVSYSDAKIAVDTEQENAYLRLKRNKGDTSDFIQVQCMGCDESNAFDEGSAFLIHKAVPLGEPFSSGEDDEETGLFRNFDTSILSIEVNVKDGKAVFDADRSIFGAFAEQQERHAVLLDTTIFEIPGEEGKQQLRLGQEKGIAAMVVETLDAEGNRLKSPQRIDFSSRIMMGEPIIVTTETNLRTIEQLLSVQGEERIDVLANSEFDEDPALRKRLLRDLEIDIDLRKNPEYVQELRTSLQEQRFADEQIRELEQKYGIVLKDGVCRGEDCNKITRSEVKGENLFLLYSAIQINQRQAANTRLGALLLSGENKENEENDKTDKKFIQEIIAENSQEIARLVTRRNNVNEIAEGRIETARKAEDRLHLPEGYADDALEAENLGAIRGELAQMRSETKADL